MKKIGINLLLVLVLVTTLSLGIVSSAYAAKPVKLGITIVDIRDGSITVNYWWNKIGAHYYAIGIYNSTNGAMNATGQIALGGRTPSLASSMTLTSVSITCGQEYRAIMWLYRKPNVRINRATAQDREFLECHLFAENFFFVADYNLPEGWTTSNASKTYAYHTSMATGTAPELYIEYGDSSIPTYDYWVSTPAIDATGTTSALNLTFKHRLDIYGFAKNFTYSVEVSNNGGLNWTAVLEETPTEVAYPGDVIGPETVNIDLGAYVGDNILIRWRLREYTYFSDGWWIDDVYVDGS